MEFAKGFRVSYYAANSWDSRLLTKHFMEGNKAEAFCKSVTTPDTIMSRFKPYVDEVAYVKIDSYMFCIGTPVNFD